MAEHLVSCPVCGHPTRKHNDLGCTMGHSGEACFCVMIPAEINPPAPQPAAPAVDEWVDALTAGEAPAANPHYHCSTQDTRPCPTGEHANPAPVAAHRQVAGWGGVPGECGVECACGTTFDHFGTIGEAAALLDSHIAAANSANGDDESDVDELDGIGSEYIKDPAERIRAFAAIAPEYVRPVDQPSPAPVDEPEPAASAVVEPPAPAPAKPRRRPAPSTKRRLRVLPVDPVADAAAPVPSPAPAELPATPFTQALDWWDSWRCGRCFSRYFTPRRCCGVEAEPVRVFVMPREVPGA